MARDQLGHFPSSPHDTVDDEYGRLCSSMIDSGPV